MKWDEVKFKAERGNSSGDVAPHSGTSTKKQFGVTRDGKTFTNTRGETGKFDYARRYNPSKLVRSCGYYDAQGNFHEID